MFGRVEKLEKACSQNPDVPLFARLADLYLHRGMVHRALALCEEGCERFPSYATGYMILGKCYEAQEKLEAARMAGIGHDLTGQWISLSLADGSSAL